VVLILIWVEEMKQAMIIDILSQKPVVKGDLLFDCPAFAFIDIRSTNTDFNGSDLMEGKQKFSKEFYDSVELKTQADL
jgi:hypothetical protein